MNLEVKEIIKELKRVYNGSPWLGNSIKSVLEGIDEKTAFKQALPNVNTIASLVSHMIGWRLLLLKRLEGDENHAVKQKQTFDFSGYGEEPQIIWDSLILELESNQNRIINLLEQKEDLFLKEKVANKRFTYKHLINGIIQHDIYHMGQIAILKK